MSVGQWIYAERKHRGWSQFELGMRARIEPRTIRRYERGDSKPDNGSLERIASAFGVLLPWQEAVADSSDQTTARYLGDAIRGSLIAPLDLASAAMD